MQSDHILAVLALLSCLQNIFKRMWNKRVQKYGVRKYRATWKKAFKAQHDRKKYQ